MKRTAALIAALVVALTLLAGAPSAGYAPGSELTVAIKCPTQPASDPTFSFILTNHGAAPVEVPDTQVPIDIMVHLTVKDANGSVVQPGVYNSGTRSARAPRILQPGQSLALQDWVDHSQPQTSVIPLHLFGYTLAPGTYDVSAKATDSADEPASNVCKVTVT
jgi:hypothetical protein